MAANRTQRTADRLLLELKMRGEATAAQLAKRLGVTAVAVRQQLDRLQAEDMVQAEDRAAGVGRPARWWSLGPAAAGHFPDTHAALTSDLIAVLRDTLGQPALDAVVQERHRRTLASYRERLAGARTPAARLARLAALRTEEGYMARVSRQDDGSWLLLEDHCPICVAATACQGFCDRELDLFRALLPGHSVLREEHLLAGARRCAYRVAADADANPAPQAAAGSG